MTRVPFVHTFIALFYGLRELPLADVVSLTFGGPIFVTVASIFFLSEKVGIKRWSAVFLGFIGMLLIIQPAFVDLNYYYFSPIIFCIFFACVAISVRSLSKTEANYTIAFYFTLLCTLLGLGSIFFVEWKIPTFIDPCIFKPSDIHCIIWGRYSVCPVYPKTGYSP